MKVPHISMKKIFYNNKSLFILSLVAALLLWFIVVSNIMPGTNKSIGGVQVLISEENPVLRSIGLQVIDTDHPSVSVEVSGPRYLVGQLSSKDFIVTARLNPVNGAGTFQLQLNATLANANSALSIKGVSPSSVNVYFDRLVTRKMPVSVVTVSSKVADGYMLGTPTANPETVTVIGPEQQLNKLQKAIVAVNVNDGATDAVTATSNIVLYNRQKQADVTHLKMDATQAQITVPVLKTKTINLKLDYSNAPADFNVANVSTMLSPAQIEVAGKASVIDALSSTLSLGNVDIQTLNVQNTQKFDISLPDGIIAVNGANTSTAAITLNNTGSGVYSTRKFTVVNLPSGYGINIRTSVLDNIQLMGPSSAMANVGEPLATIDMGKAFQGVGAQDAPVTISVPGQNGFWVKGAYKVRVYVYRK